MKKRFSVFIILRKDKRGLDGRCPLNVQVTLNSKVMKLPIGHKIFENEWDSINRYCKGKGFGELNIYLNEVANRLRKFCLSKTTNEEPLTLDLIREYHSGVNLNCFYKIFDKVFEIKKKKLSEASIYKYELLRRNLKEFKSRIEVSQVDLDFIEKFEDFLKAKGSGKFGICSNHTKLVAIINLAIKHKLMKENPYSLKEYKEVSEKYEFLTPGELEKFSKINVGIEKGLKLTKDRFLFSCYTGLRHSDINNLTKGNVDIKKGIISLKQKKTKGSVKIPLNTKIRLLIAKYYAGKDNEDLLFPSVTNQNDNERLKILAKKIDLKINLTFHVARHTFGTMMVNYLKIPLPQVSKLMGHSDIGITAKYANTDLTMLKEAMSKMN